MPARLHPLSVRPLTPKQLQAVELFACGATIEAVCRHIKIGRMTAYRWRRNTTFTAAVTQRLAEAMEQVRGKLLTTAPQATDLLIQHTLSGKKLSSTRLATARWIVERVAYLAPQAGTESSLVTLSQTVSGSADQLAELIGLLATDQRTAGASGVIISGELASPDAAKDPPSD